MLASSSVLGCLIMSIDPTVTGLVGTLIGASVGIVGSVVAAWSSLRRERETFLRGASLQHIDRVRATYENALNLLFKTTHGESPSRESFGSLVARVSLFGSSEVQSRLNAFLGPDSENRHSDFERLVSAMKIHLSALESSQIRE